MASLLIRSLTFKNQQHFAKQFYFIRNYQVGIIGAGRIGRVHAESLSRAGAHVSMIADPLSSSAKKASEDFNIPIWTTNSDDIIQNKDIQAVIICSPTNLHAKQIEDAAKQGKNIFCEKPIDLDLNIVNNLLPKVEASGVKVMLGFNRRFDDNFLRLKKAVEKNEIGKINMLRITSRDPGPPPIEYIKVSGGMFCDMTIHDFDLARYLVNDEVEEVYATGQCHNSDIAKAGDIDTGLCILKFKNGVLGYIENSREAVYGYDQRVEILGSEGSVQADNNYPNNVIISNRHTIHRDLPLNFFLERYMKAYVNEMKIFLDACIHDKPLPVGMNDGKQALLLAKAADLSLKENRPVRICELEI